MGYILKDTTALINSKLTDVGRQKLSQGLFDIRYFQVGDSEVNYDVTYNPLIGTQEVPIQDGWVLQPIDNAQNDTGIPQSNKQHVKYPFYVQGTSGSTYGLPIPQPLIESVFNTAAPLGFFSADTSNVYTAFTSSAYTITSNLYIDGTTGLSGNSCVQLLDSFCSSTTGTPQVGDFMTIFVDGTNSCGLVQPPGFPILTYKIQEVYSGITGLTVCLDRPLPNMVDLGCTGDTRALIYPSGMTVIYDTITPESYWSGNVLNYESYCQTSGLSVPIWNMNIPWSVSPAGLYSTSNLDYRSFGSINYIGTKEYLGYQSISGQTFVDASGNTALTQTYYYNSFDEKVFVLPEEQKAIAIVHYTNNSINNFYGEKFATEPYDITNPGAAGQARNFKITIPWLMWHKNTGCTIGETFFIDPPGFDNLNLFDVNFMTSNQNTDMNEPGMRYFQLWDTNPNNDGYPNRVGKVYPDQKIVVFDDEEIIAAMSYKSNRNWTLPAPKLGLITPNICEGGDPNIEGILSGDNQTMWVTYRFNSSAFTDSLHCNYYTPILGPTTGCTTGTQNVTVRFGNEFCFLQEPCSGYSANEFVILAQITTGGTLPTPTNWVEIDFTDKLAGSLVNGYIPSTAMTNTTFVIDVNRYDNGTPYDLSDYIQLPTIGQDDYLNFGDEYYFYGNIQTDITATIYEMRFAVNLIDTQFTNSSNPSRIGPNRYITEVGLYDSQKDLIVISKMQYPIIRTGTQQFLIKLDF
jgi:hypothetical protein